MGIAASILDGLLLGSGDAVIGHQSCGRQRGDDRASCCDLMDALRQRFEIPMQSCVLAHVTTQMAALEAGAPVDLIFQSIAGTEAANRSFGVSLALLTEANEAGQSLKRGAVCADGQVGGERDVLRDGAGIGALGQRASSEWTSRRWRRGPMAWRGASIRCW